MRSTIAIQCRALALLICAVAIPMIAVFGQSATASFGPWLELTYQDAMATVKANLGSLAFGAAGQNGVNDGALCLIGARPDHPSPCRPKDVQVTGFVPAASNRSPGAADTPPIPRGPSQVECEAQVWPPSVSAGGRWDEERPAAGVALDAGQARGKSMDSGQPGSDAVGPSVPMAGQGVQSEPRITALQRLQELGATWFALQPWGADGHFRFACKVACGGSVDCTRLFQATDADPGKAVARVLDEVERWRRAAGEEQDRPQGLVKSW